MQYAAVIILIILLEIVGAILAGVFHAKVIGAWLPHAVNCVRFCFSTVCDFFICFLFVYEICQEPLNGFAPNSRKMCVVPRSDEGQKILCALPSPPGSDGMERASCN